jgi:hypothetical protein
MEKLTISFDVFSSDITCPFYFEARCNNQSIANVHHVVKEYTFTGTIDLTDGEYELTFVIANKPDDFTKLDENNNIIKDALLTINNIKFDDLNIDLIVHQLAEYHVDNLPTTKFYGDAGCNGQIKLKITSPYYLWLLENL